jgi:hypothetical protein
VVISVGGLTLKKGAMPIPEWTMGWFMGYLVFLYMLTPEEQTLVRKIVDLRVKLLNTLSLSTM